MHQEELFDRLVSVYRAEAMDAYNADGSIDNATLYARLAINERERKPVGRAGAPHNLEHRKVRWSQQTAKRLGLIERVPGQRGCWRLVPRPGDDSLTAAPAGVAMVAFSTELGLAIWTRHESVLPHLQESISAVITSPPYPLRVARNYGGPTTAEFADFICRSLEPLLTRLVRGGSVALNVTNDLFEPKSPARSTYLERMVIALEDRLGLKLMERGVWTNPSKPPGPTYWACRTRQQLAVGYEPVLIFSNDAVNWIADNRRVLEPHSEKHLKLIAAGGERRTAKYGDGAYSLRPGSFGRPTAGKIPRNVMQHSHKSAEVQATRRAVQAAGLPTHGALMPLSLAKFLVQFLCPKDATVLDNWGGWSTVGLAAQHTGRRWITTEMHAEYCAGAAIRFQNEPGFLASLDIAHVADTQGASTGLCWPEHGFPVRRSGS